LFLKRKIFYLKKYYGETIKMDAVYN